MIPSSHHPSLIRTVHAPSVQRWVVGSPPFKNAEHFSRSAADVLIQFCFLANHSLLKVIG